MAAMAVTRNNDDNGDGGNNWLIWALAGLSVVVVIVVVIILFTKKKKINLPPAPAANADDALVGRGDLDAPQVTEDCQMDNSGRTLCAPTAPAEAIGDDSIADTWLLPEADETPANNGADTPL